MKKFADNSAHSLLLCKFTIKNVLIFPLILHMGFTPLQTVLQDSNLGQWVMSLV
jgi:hypothetical protein